MFGNTLYQLIVLLLGIIIAFQLALRGAETNDFNLELKMSSSRHETNISKSQPEPKDVESHEPKKGQGDQTRRWPSDLRLVAVNSGR